MMLGRLVAAVFSLAVASAAAAQPFKIGVMTLGVGASSPYLEALRRALRDHGYVEGKNVIFEYRFAQGYAERLPGLAADLVRLNPHVIVSESTPTAIALNQATKKIPIVMAIGTDPVKTGLAASLARPGGNVTGLTLAGADRTAKQLQLLKESFPTVLTVAAIYGSRVDSAQELNQAAQAARSLGLVIQFFEVRSPDDLEDVFAKVASARSASVITIGHGILLANRKRIVDFTLKNRLPAVFPEREFADDGGLMAYGPDLAANFSRAAVYVDKILKGARPAELPIEQPTKWGLVVNGRTAKALGMKIPSSVMVRADELIQ